MPFCAADPIGGARVNVIGTATVFEAARRHGLRRVAYASSIGAHGAPEDSPYLATLYGAYKACDEAMARVYWRDWEVPSVGIRPGIVYGVGRDQGLTSKTTVAILAAAAGREYEVPFSGAVSYLYAGEVASAFVQAVSRDREGAPVFDCVGRSTTVEDGLAALRRLVPDARVGAGGEPLPFPFEDRDALLRDHIGDYGSVLRRGRHGRDPPRVPRPHPGRPGVTRPLTSSMGKAWYFQGVPVGRDFSCRDFAKLHGAGLPRDSRPAIEEQEWNLPTDGPSSSDTGSPIDALRPPSHAEWSQPFLARRTCNLGRSAATCCQKHRRFPNT